MCQNLILGLGLLSTSLRENNFEKFDIMVLGKSLSPAILVRVPDAALLCPFFLTNQSVNFIVRELFSVEI